MNCPWREVSPDGIGPAIRTSLTERETAKLRQLAKGRRVLEVGAAFGYSAVVMGQAARSVTSVDPHFELASQDLMLRNLRAYGLLARVQMVIGSSQQMLPTMAEGSFDMAFVDGDHRAAAVEHDVRQAWRLVRTGGVIACHDYDEAWCPEVRPVLDRELPGGILTDTLWVVQR